MLFTDKSRGIDFSKDPCFVKFLGKYFLYYSAPPKPGEGFSIGIAQSDDLEEFTKIGEISAQGKSEKKGICAPGAIVLGDTVHLFYQNYGNGKNDSICHAWSKDGINFTRNKTNPIYRPSTSWCCGRAIDADVVQIKDELFLYIATRDDAFEIQKLGVASAKIDSDFSKDSWTERFEGAILEPMLDWEQKCIEAPATIYKNGKVYMFYGGAYNCCPQQIGCAVSEDGIHFERLFSKPFLPNGKEGEWNSCESGHPYVFEDDDGRIYLFYQGSDDGGQSFRISKIEIEIDDIPKIIKK